jgi:hypothetical protein
MNESADARPGSIFLSYSCTDLGAANAFHSALKDAGLAVFLDKASLWKWKTAIRERLCSLRLTIHETRAQVTPVSAGIPWLGFVVVPNHRRVKARKLRFATRRLRARYDAHRAGAISCAEFDASVQGWINHVRYADTIGLRGHMLEPFVLQPGDCPRRKSARRFAARQ